MAKAEWIPRRLDELGFIGRGKSRHRPRNDSRLYGGPYPFIQTADVMAADPYITSYSQTYSEFGLEQSKMWPPNTLCMTIAGANTAKTAILRIEACFPDSIVGFIPDNSKADLHFVKYSLDLMRYQFLSVSRGATQDNLSLDKLLSFPIRTPHVEEQRRIAGILSAYDELIENSQRRIKILETMARALYREWFVNFRFPGHENHPRVASPLGEIPHGWEVGEFRDIFDISYGKTLPKSEILDIGPFPVYGAGDVIGYYDRAICRDKCALVTSRGNGSGTVWRTRTAAFVTNNSLIILPKVDRNYWDYSFVELLLKHSNVMAAKTGSAQPQVTIENLNYVKALVPSKQLVEAFCAIATPLNEQIDLLYLKIENLRRTRDLLLPRLLSGQINVEAA